MGSSTRASEETRRDDREREVANLPGPPLVPVGPVPAEDRVGDAGSSKVSDEGAGSKV
jgi:hypothetical protein